MTDSLKFSKYEAIGNDYIVINPNDLLGELSAKAVEKICDRHFGIGGDGVLLGPLNSTEPYQLIIFNSDGSTAEKSGNGLRIFSKYLFDNGYLDGEEFRLQVRDTIIQGYRENRAGNFFRLNMGAPVFNIALRLNNDREEVITILDQAISFDPDTTLRVSAVSMGNPHCVVMDPGFTLQEIKKIGALIETHPMFPNRTNVQFLKVIDRSTISIHIWERGSGYTLSSGSSSCAAGSVAKKLGLVDESVLVQMPGGNIELQFDDQFNVHMLGPVNLIAEGKLASDFLSNLS